MIIHDPITRDRLLTEAGGICGTFKHRIQASNGFLEKNDSATKVMGWMAGICYLGEVINEVSKVEFRDVFTVARVPTDRYPTNLHFAPFDDLTEAESKWAAQRCWFQERQFPDKAKARQRRCVRGSADELR